MRVRGVTVIPGRAAVRLAASVELEKPGEAVPLYFDYQVRDPGYVGPSAEATAAALLLPAMRAGQPLTILPAMSPCLCFNLPRVAISSIVGGQSFRACPLPQRLALLSSRRHSRQRRSFPAASIRSTRC